MKISLPFPLGESANYSNQLWPIEHNLANLEAMPDKKQLSHTSDNELSHSMAHYLLTVHKLREEKGYARVTDIAKDLGLTKGSVSTALNNLKKKEELEVFDR